MPLSQPEPLANIHKLSDFVSGSEALDDWLRHYARADQANGTSRTFVTTENKAVVGYYTLCIGSVMTFTNTNDVPEQIPVVVLSRFAINRTQQGRGIGRALFQDCILRIASAAALIGVYSFIVHAFSDKSRDFYLKLGFEATSEPMILMVKLHDIWKLME